MSRPNDNATGASERAEPRKRDGRKREIREELGAQKLLLEGEITRERRRWMSCSPSLRGWIDSGVCRFADWAGAVVGGNGRWEVVSVSVRWLVFVSL